MKTHTFYEASDGLLFEDEETCKLYEEELHNDPDDDGLFLYDAFGCRIPLKLIEAARHAVITNSIKARCILKSVNLSKIGNVKLGHIVGTCKVHRNGEWELIETSPDFQVYTVEATKTE